MAPPSPSFPSQSVLSVEKTLDSEDILGVRKQTAKDSDEQKYDASINTSACNNDFSLPPPNHQEMLNEGEDEHKEAPVTTSILSSVGESPSNNANVNGALPRSTSNPPPSIHVHPHAHVHASSIPRLPISQSFALGSVDELTVLSLLRYYHETWRDGSAFNIRSSDEAAFIQQRVNSLWKLDYQIENIQNVDGEFCMSYPLQLTIMKAKHAHNNNGIASTDIEKLKSLFASSRWGRVRGRFIMPAILIDGKYICRSSTISIQAEATFNNLHAKTKQLFGSLISIGSTLLSTPTAIYSAASSAATTTTTSPASPVFSAAAPSPPLPTSATANSTSSVQAVAPPHSHSSSSSLSLSSSSGSSPISSSNFFSSSSSSGLSLPFSMNPFGSLASARSADLDLLSYLGVDCIFDLMVEQRKMKLGLQLASSEKVEAIYSQLKINSLPYPGCEFFLHYRRNGWNADRLLFDWNQSSIDAQLNITPHLQQLLADTFGKAKASEKKKRARSARRKRWKLNHQLHSFCSCDGDSSDEESETTEQMVDGLTNHPQNVTTQASGRLPRNRSNECLSSSNSTEDLLSLCVHVDERANVSVTISTPLPESASALSNDSSVSPWNLSHYRHWDLNGLTKNYLLIILSHVADESCHGFVVHCLSGWDRTPLWLSFIRLSLWADGHIHCSLSPIQMLYFTLAYDWLLFCHQFTSRLEKGEDILFFAFDFLKEITSRKFSLQYVKRKIQKQKDPKQTNSQNNAPGSKRKGIKPAPNAALGVVSPSHSSAQSAAPASFKVDDEYFSASARVEKQHSPHSAVDKDANGGEQLRHRRDYGVQLNGRRNSVSKRRRMQEGALDPPISPSAQQLHEESVDHQQEQDDSDDENDDESDDWKKCKLRCQRLLTVRSLFLQIYQRAIPQHLQASHKAPRHQPEQLPPHSQLHSSLSTPMLILHKMDEQPQRSSNEHTRNDSRPQVDESGINTAFLHSASSHSNDRVHSVGSSSASASPVYGSASPAAVAAPSSNSRSLWSWIPTFS